MLTQEMVHLITTYTIGCVATVRPDGSPAVSPKATFLVLDDRTLAFANIRSPGTVENLHRRPNVEVNFIDIFARKGCRVRGRARFILRDDTDTDIMASFNNKWPDLYPLIQGIVVIAVTEAEALSSPSYDVGATANQLTEQWLCHYAAFFGFAVTKETDRSLLSASTASEDA